MNLMAKKLNRYITSIGYSKGVEENKARYGHPDDHPALPFTSD
jgi:hypothetical protein